MTYKEEFEELNKAWQGLKDHIRINILSPLCSSKIVVSIALIMGFIGIVIAIVDILQ
jgi:hypothetical protein